MKHRTIFMFSGQGSQYYQMGKEFQEDPIFSHWMKQGADILEGIGQPSFLSLLYETTSRESWNDLLLTHPGLVIIEYATFQVLKNLGLEPDAILGFSIGEFSAAAAANVLTFEEAIKAAYEQAKIIADICPIGGMTAVLAPPHFYEQSVLKEYVHLAGINYNEHFMIAGKKNSLEKAHRFLKLSDKTFISLPVNYAFHSPEITQAQIPFESYFKKSVQLKNSSIPLVSSLTGQPLEKIDCSHFWNVVYEPLNFQNVISILESNFNNLFVDLGPSGTLATFIKYNLLKSSSSLAMPLLTPFHNGKKNLEQLSLFLKEHK